MDKPRWLLTAFVFVPLLDLSISQYEPNWKSLDSRPLPTWFDEAKIGLFLHWGVYSVPSYGPAWFWYMWVIEKDPKIVEFMHKNYKPGFTYPEFASQFTCEFYDPDHWTDIFSASGAKYVVLTTKHHDGYTLWPSKTSWNWNAVDIGPKRDLVGDLANSIRKKTDIRFGVYHSLFDGLNPLYLQDKVNHWKTQDFVERKTMPELYELVNTYSPDVIWSDGDWEAPDTYWNSTHFLAWLYNDSPVKRTVVVNDRWGSGTSCRHGDFYNCQDRYNPKTLQKHKWENAMTLDRVTWPFRRSATLSDILSIQQLISTLTETISCGGNILINVGPTPDGRIPLIFEERLRQLGQWLKVNGEAIYGTKPWVFQNDTLTSGVWYTAKELEKDNVTVYVIVLKWPKRNKLQLGTLELSEYSVISMLGWKDDLKWSRAGKTTLVYFPSLTPDQLPSPWAWVLKVQGWKNH